ncbi:glycosyltransferase, partial [Aduncisulcus paluster]
MLLAEQGNIAEAIKMLEDWLHSVNISKNIGHLLYGLLLRQHEPASLSNSKISFVVVDNAHPELLGRTLKSIFAQKHANWELIIISDSNPGKDGLPERSSGLVYSTEFQKQMAKLQPERLSFINCSTACAEGCVDGCPETGPELD